jgi:hypothetical protein
MRKSEYAALVKACSIAFCPNYYEEQRLGAELIVKRIERALKLEGLCRDAREEEENHRSGRYA